MGFKITAASGGLSKVPTSLGGTQKTPEQTFGISGGGGSRGVSEDETARLEAEAAMAAVRLVEETARETAREESARQERIRIAAQERANAVAQADIRRRIANIESGKTKSFTSKFLTDEAGTPINVTRKNVDIIKREIVSGEEKFTPPKTQRGGVFFTPKEAKDRGLGKPGEVLRTEESKTADVNIRLAEEILGLPQGGSQFGLIDDLQLRKPDSAVVRGKSGGVSIFGTAAKGFFEFSDIVGEKTGISKVIEGTILDVNIPKGAAIRGGSDILTSAFFLGPISTTTQIEKEIATLTEIGFVGVSSSVGKKGISSKIDFVLKKGRTFEKGSARSASVIVDQADDITSIITRTKGAAASTRVKFPTGNELVKVTRQFVGQERTLVQGSEDVFAVISKGQSVPNILTRDNVVSSITTSIGKTTGDLIRIAGFSRTTAGNVVFKGSIKTIPTVTGDSVVNIVGGATSKISQKTIQRVLGQTAATIVKPPAQTLGTVGVAGTGVLSVSTTITTQPKVVTSTSIKGQKVQSQIKIIQPTLTPSAQSQGVNTKQRIDISTVQAQSPSLKVGQGQIISPRQAPISKARIFQTVREVQTQATRQATVKTPTFSITTPPPTTTITKVPFIPFSTIKIAGSNKLPRAGFGVAVRRGGRFTTIGSGLSLQRAVNIGRQRVGSTLAATFKIIPQAKGISSVNISTPKGFRQAKGLTFVEQRGLRLSTGTEVGEIKIAKARKSRKKKKK